MHLRTCWRRLPLAVVLALALTAGLTAQTPGKTAGGPTAIRVDGAVIKSYIAYMAADDKEGRETLTPGFDKVVAWAADRFKEWGLKPAGENGTYLQDVPIESSVTWTTGTPELVVDGRPFLIKDSDFQLDARSTPGVTAAGEIVFVGYGISAPAKGLDEYAGVDVKGKIVLAFKGSPKDAPAARGMFGATPPEPKSTEAWTAEAKDAAKVTTAYEKGAAAIVLFAPEKLLGTPVASSVNTGRPMTFAEVMAARGMGGSGPGEFPAFSRPFLAVVDVNERAFRQVMYRDPQESPGGFRARMDQWRRDIRDGKSHSLATTVKAQIKGYATTAFYGPKYKNHVSHNVIGKVEGTDPTLKAQVIVIGGHLDHVGMTNGVVYNGADDNASGAATTMEMARLFAKHAATIKPKRTIYFALWCGEEEGLLGSEYWVKHPTDGVTVPNIVANFNNDMVGLGDRIGAPGGLNFPSIWAVIMRHQEPDVVKDLETSTAGPGGSDYSAFIEQGIESLALMTAGGTGHPDYHDAGDDTDKIDAEMLRKNGQFVLQGVINVANETAVPLLIPNRLETYEAMRFRLLNLATVSASDESRYFLAADGRIQPAPYSGPRFRISLDVAALGGNEAMIDTAVRLLSVGRVEVVGIGESAWFSNTGVTDRGKAALKLFENAGVVLQFTNTPPRLLADVLDTVKKGVIINGLASPLAADLAKKIVEKNAVVAVEFDAAAPQDSVDRLVAFKQALGGSGNLVLTTQDRPAASAMGNIVATPHQKAFDAAKQQVYLALLKAGWPKDDINALVGITPRPADPAAPRPAAARLGGNLGKLTK